MVEHWSNTYNFPFHLKVLSDVSSIKEAGFQEYARLLKDIADALRNQSNINNEE